MPGGRLTPTDRQRIAEGLKEGLGYAEIARQLHRPTSTISREVARNTGKYGYRADLAVRATQHRARRRKPAQPEARPTDEYGRDMTKVAAFEDYFVSMVVDTGLPRMAARVLTRLYVTDAGRLTAADLVAALRVSPASISKAVHYLDEVELISREKDAHRREHYVVDDDFLVTAWTAGIRKNVMWAETSRQGALILGEDTPAGTRLNRLGDFYDRLNRDMLGEPVTDDAMVVFAALVQARGPLSLPALVSALDWSEERVGDAMEDLEEKSYQLEPLMLRVNESGEYSLEAAPGWLTPEQRAALT